MSVPREPEDRGDEPGDTSSRLPGHPERERLPHERRHPGDVGREPDPRFTFANERTMLAWNRTALALVSAGAAAAAFLDDLGGARLAVSIPLIVIGTAIAIFSFRRWEAIEVSLRMREPIPYSSVPKLLGSAVAVLAVVVAVLAVVDVVG